MTTDYERFRDASPENAKALREAEAELAVEEEMLRLRTKVKTLEEYKQKVQALAKQQTPDNPLDQLYKFFNDSDRERCARLLRKVRAENRRLQETQLTPEEAIALQGFNTFVAHYGPKLADDGTYQRVFESAHTKLRALAEEEK